MNKRTFDPAKAFFVIDSDCLDRVSEAFYGFTILDSRPVRTLEELGNREPEGDGAYVLVRRNGDKITISQDFIGGFGSTQNTESANRIGSRGELFGENIKTTWSASAYS